MPSITFDVKSLSDEELFKKLLDFGVDVGPIVESTRKLYEKKLLRLQSGDTDVVDSTNELIYEAPIEEKHSPKTKAKPVNVVNDPISIRSTMFSERSEESSNITRKRATNYEPEIIQQNLGEKNSSYGPDLHVLSPRPSLRSVTTTTTTTKYITPGGSIRESTLLRETYAPASTVKTQQPTMIIRLLVKILIIFIVIGIIYVSYQYVYSESPFKELENLARQTLNSIQNDEAGSPSKTKSPKIK